MQRAWVQSLVGKTKILHAVWDDHHPPPPQKKNSDYKFIMFVVENFKLQKSHS